MNESWKKILWQQFGASLDMLENAIRECPEKLWRDQERYHQVWYMAFHTLFWTDLYLSGAVEEFAPPEPYGLEELDPAGVMPGHVHSQPELLAYLEHCRDKLHKILKELTDESANRRCEFNWGAVSYSELLLYNLRHVQHHTAQLNLILRLETDSAPRWVGVTKAEY